MIKYSADTRTSRLAGWRPDKQRCICILDARLVSLEYSGLQLVTLLEFLGKWFRLVRLGTTPWTRPFFLLFLVFFLCNFGFLGCFLSHLLGFLLVCFPLVCFLVLGGYLLLRPLFFGFGVEQAFSLPQTGRCSHYRVLFEVDKPHISM